MKSSANSINAEFACLHGISTDGLSLLVDMLPHITGRAESSSFSHPPSSMPRSSAVQDCYRLRLEAAERRYARLKGLVVASLDAQHRMRVENESLRVAQTIVRLGLETECAVTLETMLAVNGRADAVVSEMRALTLKLGGVVDENEKLMAFNRELRAEAVDASMAGVGGIGRGVSAAGSPTSDMQVELETQRVRITALELECVRLQSRPALFDDDERLRECEDVFDRILGRERLDSCVEDVPGASLQRYHPVGTCSDPSCVAYARRLRGGLRGAVTAAYARERNERVNGFIQHSVRSAAVVRVEKDLEIKALNDRICRFEQSTRMTSGEADRVELRAVSQEIADAMTELGRVRSEVAGARRECAQMRSVLSGLCLQEQAITFQLEEAQTEIASLMEERALTNGARDMLAQERARLEAVRTDVLRFRDGRMGSALKEQKAQVEALRREMDGMRVDQGPFVSAVDGPAASAAEMAPPPSLIDDDDNASAVSDARTNGKKQRTARLTAAFSLLPGKGLCVLCRCGERIPLSQVAEHVQQAHAVSSRRIIVCGMGCGYFVTNGSRAEIDKHMRSSSCALRVAEIQRLTSSSGAAGGGE